MLYIDIYYLKGFNNFIKNKINELNSFNYLLILPLKKMFKEN